MDLSQAIYQIARKLSERGWVSSEATRSREARS